MVLVTVMVKVIIGFDEKWRKWERNLEDEKMKIRSESKKK